MDYPINLNEWYTKNKSVFKHPICNALLHNNQLYVKVEFVVQSKKYLKL